MAKIHIVGGPGSGKTTLAQDLSSRFHVPHYDLDKVNWEKENVIAIAEQPAWVTEGIYLIWTEPMLYHADCIVLLRSPGLWLHGAFFTVISRRAYAAPIRILV